MKKTLALFVVGFFVLGMTQLAQAQLLKQRPAPAAPAPAAPAPKASPVKATSKKASPLPVVTPAPIAVTEAPVVVSQEPSWAINAPVADAAELVNFDINGDGNLQPSEVRIYLREVMDKVSMDGNVAADNSLLKGYDQNRDGMIDSFETVMILEDVNK